MSSIWDCGRELFENWSAVRACQPALGCLPEFHESLIQSLGICRHDFFLQCEVEKLVRICPFDPAWDAFEWKQQLVSERLEALEVQVKELQAMLPKGK